MTWYKLVLEQKQPIHIGFKKYGVLAETRIFIPGQTIWGALTKAYFLSLNENERKKYSSISDEKIQKLFEQITCFYPYIDEGTILKPNFKNGEFHLGGLSEKEFRLLFVDSYTSTAILSETRTAKDESLHEIEFILPKPKKSLENTKLWKKLVEEWGYKGENLKWIGLINIDEKLKDEINNLELFIGGDSRYGFGLMKIMRDKIIEADDNFKDKFDIQNDMDDNLIKGKLKNYTNEILLNYLEFDPEIKFKGRLELLTEYDFYNKKMKDSKYYIIPGSEIISE